MLASDCTASNTLVALPASVVVIVATTLTLAALTASEMASGATPTEAARLALKPSWSKVSTVPATVSESSITCCTVEPGESGGEGGGGDEGGEVCKLSMRCVDTLYISSLVRPRGHTTSSAIAKSEYSLT